MQLPALACALLALLAAARAAPLPEPAPPAIDERGFCSNAGGSQNCPTW